MEIRLATKARGAIDMKDAYKVLFENVMGREHLEGLDADGRIIRGASRK